MKKGFSEKIIKKFNFGDKNLKNYERLINDYKNEIECKGIYCSDFSEFKKTISFFITSSKEKEIFYSQLIHDIKSPILSIEFAIRNSDGNYPIKDIYNINSSILELINNSLELYSKRKEKGEIDINDLLNKTIQNHKFLIEDKNLDFEINIKNDLEFFGYPTHLERIFSNLIFNAIKHSPSNSKIKIYQKEKNVLCFKNLVLDKASSKGYGLGLKIIEDLCKKSDILFYKRKFLNTMTFCLKFQKMS